MQHDEQPGYPGDGVEVIGEEHEPSDGRSQRERDAGRHRPEPRLAAGAREGGCAHGGDR